MTEPGDDTPRQPPAEGPGSSGSSPSSVSAESAPSAPSAPAGAGWRPTPLWYMAEIIVVVVGVVIALAANAWWEGRRTAILQDEVREVVRAELESNVAELETILAVTDECVDRMDRFLRMSPAALAAVPADSTFYWVSALSCRRTFEPAFGAARALTGAPGFESVEDVRVRAAVADWVMALDDADEERAALSDQGDQVYGVLSRYAEGAADDGLAGFPTIPRLVARRGGAVLAELRRDGELIQASLRRSHYQQAYSEELAEALAAGDTALARLDEADR